MSLLRSLLLATALLCPTLRAQEHHHVHVAYTGTAFHGDKQLHFIIGFAAANFGWAIAKDWGLRHPHLYGLAAAILCSLWKEHQDWKKANGVADGADFAYTSFGGSLVTLYAIQW